MRFTMSVGFVRRRRALALAVLLAAALTLSAGTAHALSGQAASAAAGFVPTDPAAQVERMGRGINILGYDPLWLDPARARFRARDFARIHDAGFQTVRVNLYAFSHMDTLNNLDPRWLSTLDWVIQNALAAHLIVILDEHDFNGCSADAAACRTRLLAFWRQVAERYRDAPNTVLFEILNEPHGTLTSAVWNSLLEDALTVIRATNPTRTVVIGPGFYNSIQELASLKLPGGDRNIIATVHYYLPMSFTHQSVKWNPETANLSDIAWGSPAEYARLNQDFDAAQQWSQANNRPILLGEFGTYDKAPMDSRVRYTSAVARAAEARGWAWAYWQFDTDFTAFDHLKDDWVQPIWHALIPSEDPGGRRVPVRAVTGNAGPPCTGASAGKTIWNGDGFQGCNGVSWVPLGGSAAPAVPQGRLTLASSAAVMTSDMVGATTIYYVPYAGQTVPVFNGSDFVGRSIGNQLALALDATDSDIGYQASGRLYDVFVGLNGTTLDLCTGPAWASSASRSVAVHQVKGIWTNADAIACRYGNTTRDTFVCPASRCTYVGTMYATANGQTAMQFTPAASAGGSNNVLGLYNAYNRVMTYSTNLDSTDTWTLGISQDRGGQPTDNSVRNRVTFVDGLQQSSAWATLREVCSSCTAANGSQLVISPVLNAMNFSSAQVFGQTNASYTSAVSVAGWPPHLGLNYVQGVESIEWEGSAALNVRGVAALEGLTVGLEL